MYYHFTTVIKGDNKVKTIGTPRKSADKPFLAARVPASLNDALEAHAKSTGESKTDVLINALAAYIGWSEDKKLKASSSDRLSQLEKRVQDLEEAIYKPRQTSLLEMSTGEAQPEEPVIDLDNNLDNAEIVDEWLTTKDAYEKYGKSTTYDGFRKTKPERMLERFGLEADPSRKIPGEYSSQLLRKAR